MKRLVTILFILLFLFFRQGTPILHVLTKKVDHSVLKEAELILSTPGLGFIEDRDYNDSKVITPGFQIYHEKEDLLYYVEVQEHFSFLLNCNSNPLLIDLPPPDSYS